MKTETKISITENERIVLRAIVDNEFQDGGDVIENPVWTFALYSAHKSGISGKALSGTISSLVKKGLVGVDAIDLGELGKTPHDDDTVWITAQGVAALEGDAN